MAFPCQETLAAILRFRPNNNHLIFPVDPGNPQSTFARLYVRNLSDATVLLRINSSNVDRYAAGAQYYSVPGHQEVTVELVRLNETAYGEFSDFDMRPESYAVEAMVLMSLDPAYMLNNQHLWADPFGGDRCQELVYTKVFHCIVLPMRHLDLKQPHAESRAETAAVECQASTGRVAIPVINHRQLLARVTVLELFGAAFRQLFFEVLATVHRSLAKMDWLCCCSENRNASAAGQANGENGALPNQSNLEAFLDGRLHQEVIVHDETEEEKEEELSHGNGCNGLRNGRKIHHRYPADQGVEVSESDAHYEQYWINRGVAIPELDSEPQAVAQSDPYADDPIYYETIFQTIRRVFRRRFMNV